MSITHASMPIITRLLHVSLLRDLFILLALVLAYSTDAKVFSYYLQLNLTCAMHDEHGYNNYLTAGGKKPCRAARG